MTTIQYPKVLRQLLFSAALIWTNIHAIEPETVRDSVVASSKDGILNSNGNTDYLGKNPERLGRGNKNGFSYCMVIPFQLPELRQGKISNATLTVTLENGRTDIGNVDLYGHADTDIYGAINDTKFYVDGTDPKNPHVKLLQNDFISMADLKENGFGEKTSVDISKFLQTFYDQGTPVGSYVYLILALDQMPSGHFQYLNIYSANSNYQPRLTLDLKDARRIGKAWGQTDQITQHGITWTFDRPYEYGTYVTGDYWVKGPISITGITNSLNHPEYIPRLGQNGSMINPVPGKQGYDDGISYELGLNEGLPNGQHVSIENPLRVPVDSSLVSTVSWLYNSSKDAEPDCPRFDAGYPKPMLRAAAILTVVDKAPTDFSFRPPYAGKEKSLDVQFADLDLSHLANLKPPSSGIPSISALEAAMDKPWIDHYSGYFGGYYHPTDNMPHYGLGMTRIINDSALLTQLDFSQLPGNHNKNKLIINLVQFGIDCTAVADNGRGWVADGGHMMGRKLPIIYAGLLLNDQHMLDVGTWGRNDSTETGTGVAFQEYQTHFYVDQKAIDITQGGLKADGGNWDPDFRNIKSGNILPYTKQDLGKPEWGIRHSYRGNRDNADLMVAYRIINGSANSGTALAMQIMDAKKIWKNDAFFDYADRYWAWIALEGKPAHLGTGLTREMWSMYRKDYPPVWNGNPLPNK